MGCKRRWPFPGDSPLVRSRRVALAYRHGLELADREALAALDRRVNSWGETWATPNVVTYGDSDWITTAQAAELACITPAGIGALRRRGRIEGRPRSSGRGYEYRAGEIYALLSVRRRQHPTVTDTITDSGSSLPSAGGDPT